MNTSKIAFSLSFFSIWAVATACVTFGPAGYKRLEGTKVCRKSSLATTVGGEGSVIPFFGRVMTTTMTFPLKDLGMEPFDGIENLMLSVHHGITTPLGPVSGKKLDTKTNLYFSDHGSSRFFVDNQDHPSFVYDCRLSEGEIGKCVRFADIGDWTYTTQFTNLGQWKKYEEAIGKIFEQKLIILCD